MSVHSIPICFACARRAQGSQTCEAFPEGIPDKIAIEGFDHRSEFDGDGGVLFELDESKREILGMYETARQKR